MDDPLPRAAPKVGQFCIITLSVLQDGNGTIENEELRGFLKDLLELVKKVGGTKVATSFFIVQTRNAKIRSHTTFAVNEKHKKV